MFLINKKTCHKCVAQSHFDLYLLICYNIAQQCSSKRRVFFPSVFSTWVPAVQAPRYLSPELATTLARFIKETTLNY